MVKKSKIVVALLMIVIAVGLLSTVGISAPRTVTLWTYPQHKIEEWKARQAEIEKACKISLNIVQVNEVSMVQNLQKALTDGRGYPDLIEWRIEFNQILMADPKKCFVAPLEKWTSRSKVFKNAVPGRVSYLKYGEHIYGLPGEVHPCVLIYNDTLWKSVGVDLATVETWDDFFAAASKLAAEKKDGKPVHYAIPTQQGGLSDTMFMIMQQSGAQILDKEGKPTFTSQEFRSFVQKWLDWSKTGTMGPWDWGNMAGVLRDGSLASFAAPEWWVSMVNEAARAGQYSYKVRPLPSYQKGGPRTASWGGTFLAMVKLAKDQEQLYKVMEYMQYGDRQALINRFKKVGALPPLSSVWDDPVFQQPDPRFGGQKLGELQITMAKEMPGLIVGDIFWDALMDFSADYPDMVNGRLRLGDGLTRVQERAMKRVR